MPSPCARSPHPQGTVRQKLLGAVQLDDGTGSVHCVVGAARDKPGLEINSVSPSDYCLVIGKLVGQQGGRQLTIKVHKVGAGGLAWRRQ